MLEIFKHVFKYKIQFTSDTEIGSVNITTVGSKDDAINIFLKHCRLKNPVVTDCKVVSVTKEKAEGVISYNDLEDLPDLDVYETKEDSNEKWSSMKIEDDTIYMGDRSVQFIVNDDVLNIKFS